MRSTLARHSDCSRCPKSHRRRHCSPNDVKRAGRQAPPPYYKLGNPNLCLGQHCLSLQQCSNTVAAEQVHNTHIPLPSKVQTYCLPGPHHRLIVCEYNPVTAAHFSPISHFGLAPLHSSRRTAYCHHSFAHLDHYLPLCLLRPRTILLLLEPKVKEAKMSDPATSATGPSVQASVSGLPRNYLL